MDRNIVCYMEPSARDNHETLLDALCSKQKSDPMQNIKLGNALWPSTMQTGPLVVLVQGQLYDTSSTKGLRKNCSDHRRGGSLKAPANIKREKQRFTI